MALTTDMSDAAYWLIMVSSCFGFTGMILHLGLRKLAMDYAVEMLKQASENNEEL